MMTYLSRDSITIMIVLTAIILGCSGYPPPPDSDQPERWMGTFDGRWDKRRIITSGDNILTVERAFIWDNGEGRSPDGTGKDRAWYGATHGPYGSVYIEIYGPGKTRRLGWTRLSGPHKTRRRLWEWVDNEGLEYTRYGIYDWDSHSYDRVWLRTYESDPAPFRGHDLLLSAMVNRDATLEGLRLSSDHIAQLDLKTVDLPE